MKKLATIRTVSSTSEMVGYDNIHLVHIDGWQAIAPKEITTGQTVVFIEPGAKCPDNVIFHFLQRRDFKIKTLKMGGYISQGLVLGTNILKQRPFKIGEDVTDELGLTDFTEQDNTEQDNTEVEQKKTKGFVQWLMKYKATRWLGRVFLPKKISGSFPSFVQKTDEERVQNMPWVLGTEAARWVGREKLDGMSGTWAVKKGKTWYGKRVYELYCCSRNIRLNPKYDKGTPQFQMEEKFQIFDHLKRYLEMNPSEEWACIQGECIGPKIQKNPYGLKQITMYCFNFITSNRRNIACTQAISELEELENKFSLPTLEWAPLVFLREGSIPLSVTSVQEALAYSNGKSELNPDVLREGLVIRSYDKNISFKVVSPDYLINKGE